MRATPRRISAAGMSMTSSTVILARDGARSFEGYFAKPAEARGPAILVLTDMFGLNEPIRPGS